MIRHKVLSRRPDVERVELKYSYSRFKASTFSRGTGNGSGKGPLEKTYTQISSVIFSGVMPKGPDILFIDAVFLSYYRVGFTVAKTYRVTTEKECNNSYRSSNHLEIRPK